MAINVLRLASFPSASRACAGIFAIGGLIGAMPAVAQEYSGDNAAIDFYNAMEASGVLKPIAGTSTVTLKNRRVSASYYRIVVHMDKDAVNTKNISKGCEDALKKFSNGKLLDIVFGRRYDIGLAVSLPMALVDTPASRAEVNLFRITREPKNPCRFELSYFDTMGDYQTPWIPINQAFVAEEQKAVIGFRPWVSKQDNKARVDALWAGLGALVNVVGGPVTTVSQALFGGGNDKYEIKDQAVSLLGIGGDITTPRTQVWTKRIVVNPNTQDSGPYTPGGYQFDWKLSGVKDNEPFNYNLKLSVMVEYRPSLMFPANDALPDLSDNKDIDFSALVDQSSNVEGRPWKSFGLPVDNLSKQDKIDTFNAACGPAMTYLNETGFSTEDRALLIYAMARAQLTERRLSSIGCLKESNITAGLKRFQLKVPEPEQEVLAKGKIEDWHAALNASVLALKAPGLGSGQGTAKLFTYLDDNVRIGGDSSLLADAAGKPVLPEATLPHSWDRQTLGGYLAKLKPGGGGCFAPRLSRTDSTIPAFDFPDGSGMIASQTVVAHLARMKGETVFMLLGLRGLDPKNPSIELIDQIWVGKGDATDSQLAAIRADMALNAACTGDANFKAFLGL